MVSRDVPELKNIFDCLKRTTDTIRDRMKEFVPQKEPIDLIRGDGRFLEPSVSSIHRNQLRTVTTMIHFQENASHLDVPGNAKEAALRVEDNLKRGLIKLEEEEKSINFNVKELEKEIKELEGTLKDLNEIEAGANEALSANDDNQEILPLISTLLEQLKGDLNTVLVELYPEEKDDIRMLLSLLEETRVEGADWIEIERPSKALMILMGSGIIIQKEGTELFRLAPFV